MKKKELFDFLISWNQLDKEKEGFKPINQYQLHAQMIGMNFYLKWYLPATQFELLGKELDEDFDVSKHDKLIFAFSDQTVEIEKQPEEEDESILIVEADLSHQTSL